MTNEELSAIEARYIFAQALPMEPCPKCGNALIEWQSGEGEAIGVSCIECDEVFYWRRKRMISGRCWESFADLLVEVRRLREENEYLRVFRCVIENVRKATPSIDDDDA